MSLSATRPRSDHRTGAPPKRDALAHLVECWRVYFRRLPPMCRYCAHSIDPNSIDSHEYVMWCDHCHQVVEIPLIKVPGWVVGVLVVLVIQMSCGL